MTWLGPQPHVFQDRIWSAVLKQENKKTWYHDPAWPSWMRIGAPGGFARKDASPGPTGGDGVFVRQADWEAAVRYHEAMRAGRAPHSSDEGGYSLVIHEFSHCYVPNHFEGRQEIEGRLMTWEQTLDRYSHPKGAMAAMQHALRKRCINVFSRVFRKDLRSPHEVRQDFEKWMDHWTVQWRAGLLTAHTSPAAAARPNVAG